MKCPHCQIEVSIPPALVGKDVQCPGCGKVFGGGMNQFAKREENAIDFIMMIVRGLFYVVLLVVGIVIIGMPNTSPSPGQPLPDMAFYTWKIYALSIVAFLAFMGNLLDKSFSRGR